MGIRWQFLSKVGGAVGITIAEISAGQKGEELELMYGWIRLSDNEDKLRSRLESKKHHFAPRIKQIDIEPRTAIINMRTVLELNYRTLRKVRRQFLCFLTDDEHEGSREGRYAVKKSAGEGLQLRGKRGK
jgi:hypothetical protein